MLILKTQNIGFKTYTEIKYKLIEIEKTIEELEKDKIMIDCKIRDLDAEKIAIVGKFKSWGINKPADLDTKVELEKPIEKKPEPEIID